MTHVISFAASLLKFSTLWLTLMSMHKSYCSWFLRLCLHVLFPLYSCYNQSSEIIYYYYRRFMIHEYHYASLNVSIIFLYSSINLFLRWFTRGVGRVRGFTLHRINMIDTLEKHLHWNECASLSWYFSCVTLSVPYNTGVCCNRHISVFVCVHATSTGWFSMAFAVHSGDY